MSEEINMSDAEKGIRASAVMEFVDIIRGAYASGFINNYPTNYDIYRSAQLHVKDRYGVQTDNWDDELAKESRSDNRDRLVEENKNLKDELESLEDDYKNEFNTSEDLRCEKEDLVEENKRLRDMLKRLTSHDNCRKDVIHLMSEADSLLSEFGG